MLSISHRFRFFPYAKCVLLNLSQVTHGNLKLNEALRACCLQGVVSFQKLHYHVKIARKALLSHSPRAGTARREGLVICASDCTADTRTTMSPLTEASALSAATAFAQQPLVVEEDELMPVVKRRKSSKQASEARVEAKVRSELYNKRFKSAFKEGTDLLSRQMSRTQQLPHCLLTRLLQT